MESDFLDFNWDEGNMAHIARHDVTPDEAEEAILGDALDIELQTALAAARKNGSCN